MFWYFGEALFAAGKKADVGVKLSLSKVHDPAWHLVAGFGTALVRGRRAVAYLPEISFVALMCGSKRSSSNSSGGIRCTINSVTDNGP